MKELTDVLSESLLYFELLAALVGIIYFKKFKNTQWKWFIFYLIFIVISNLFHHFYFIKHLNVKNNYFFSYFVIPIEFIFFYWLYACVSLKNRMLFWVFSFLYLLSFVLHPYIADKLETIYSFNYVMGAFFLSLLIYFEYMKQIKSDDIIRFKGNMMFYINLGVSLLYIGTLPFFSFFNILFYDYTTIFMSYFIIFLLLNHLMYLLFTFAFIWGKPNTY